MRRRPSAQFLTLVVVNLVMGTSTALMIAGRGHAVCCAPSAVRCSTLTAKARKGLPPIKSDVFVPLGSPLNYSTMVATVCSIGALVYRMPAC